MKYKSMARKDTCEIIYNFTRLVQNQKEAKLIQNSRQFFACCFVFL